MFQTQSPCSEPGAATLMSSTPLEPLCPPAGILNQGEALAAGGGQSRR